MDGLHVVGILKSIGFRDEDEPTENVSSPLGGLNGLRDRGLEKKEGSTEDDLLLGRGEICSGKD